MEEVRRVRSRERETEWNKIEVHRRMRDGNARQEVEQQRKTMM